MRLKTIFLVCFAAACLPAVGWSAWVAVRAGAQWIEAAGAVRVAIAMGDALHLVEAISIERGALQVLALGKNQNVVDWPEIQALNDALLFKTKLSLREAGLPDDSVLRANASLQAARARTAEVMKSPPQKRDLSVAMSIVSELNQRLEGVQLAVTLAEAQAAQADATIGAYVGVGSLSVELRLVAGLRGSLLSRWFADQPLTREDIDEALNLTGQIQHAWDHLQREVLIAGNPQRLAQAIEISNTEFFQKAEPRFRELLAIARSGGARPMKLVEWRSWVREPLSATLLVRDAAIAEAIDQGRKLVRQAQISLMIAATAIFGLILLAGGAFWVLLRRLVLPVQHLTATITRIAEGDLGAEVPERGRPDEIGAMATAIEVFRQNAVDLRQTNLRFDAALSNMVQGLAMFDAEERMTVFNSRLCELAQIPKSAIHVGMTFRELTEAAAAAGFYPGLTIDEICEEQARFRSPDAPKNFEIIHGDTVLLVSFAALANGGWFYSLEDITERRQDEARIAHMAHHDSLTGLPNRASFYSALEQALARSRRNQHFSVFCLDLDRFKAVNDILGHPAGDALLQEVALRLRNELRDIDIVARLGGDEFAILQANVQHPQQAIVLAQRLIEAVGAPYDIFGNHIEIGLSIGIAMLSAEEENAGALFKKADIALYQAKANGRGTWRFFEPEMNAFMHARRLLELDLRQALAGNQFELYYQPVVNLRTNRISGFEALLRWRHPERGLVPPTQFIPLAEEIGLIGAIGEWVLNRACKQAAQWQEDLRVAVNVSALQIRSGRRFTDLLTEALRLSGLPVRRLELEITETAILQDTEETLATLNFIRELGVSIAMDDFGTGYSSLSHLRHFPFNRVKIDQSFVRGLSAEETECGAIVQAIIGLCVSLGLGLTAEGVETKAQSDWLAAHGVLEGQGYLFSRPVRAEALPALIETFSNSTAEVMG